MLEIRLKGVELAGAWAFPLAVHDVLPGGGAGVALHGFLPPAQTSSDATDAVSLSEQFVHLRVVHAGALGELPRRLLFVLLRSRVFRGQTVSRRVSGAQATPVACDAAFDGLGNVLPEVEAENVEVGVQPGLGRVGIPTLGVPHCPGMTGSRTLVR